MEAKLKMVAPPGTFTSQNSTCLRVETVPLSVSLVWKLVCVYKCLSVFVSVGVIECLFL